MSREIKLRAIAQINKVKRKRGELTFSDDFEMVRLKEDTTIKDVLDWAKDIENASRSNQISIFQLDSSSDGFDSLKFIHENKELIKQ